jgi:hypothetical protein
MWFGFGAITPLPDRERGSVSSFNASPRLRAGRRPSLRTLADKCNRDPRQRSEPDPLGLAGDSHRTILADHAQSLASSAPITCWVSTNVRPRMDPIDTPTTANGCRRPERRNFATTSSVSNSDRSQRRPSMHTHEMNSSHPQLRGSVSDILIQCMCRPLRSDGGDRVAPHRQQPSRAPASDRGLRRQLSGVRRGVCPACEDARTLPDLCRSLPALLPSQSRCARSIGTTLQ